MTKGSTHHCGGRCPILLFLIKIAFVPVCPELYAGDPRRRPSHLLTDCIEGYVRAALDDQLVVDVPDDLTVRERPHGVGQNVTTYGLNDVLDEFWAVTFDAGPVLRGVDPHVSDALAAESILADPGLYVGQLPARRERDE